MEQIFWIACKRFAVQFRTPARVAAPNSSSPTFYASSAMASMMMVNTSIPN